MTKQETLTELEQLYQKPEVRNGFKSREDCLEWANSVAPLLRSSGLHYSVFVQALDELHLPLSGSGLQTRFDLMVSHLRQTIIAVPVSIERLVLFSSCDQPAISSLSVGGGW